MRQSYLQTFVDSDRLALTFIRFRNGKVQLSDLVLELHGQLLDGLERSKLCAEVHVCRLQMRGPVAQFVQLLCFLL